MFVFRFNVKVNNFPQCREDANASIVVRRTKGRYYVLLEDKTTVPVDLKVLLTQEKRNLLVFHIFQCYVKQVVMFC